MLQGSTAPLGDCRPLRVQVCGGGRWEGRTDHCPSMVACRIQVMHCVGDASGLAVNAASEGHAMAAGVQICSDCSTTTSKRVCILQFMASRCLLGCSSITPQRGACTRLPRLIFVPVLLVCPTMPPSPGLCLCLLAAANPCDAPTPGSLVRGNITCGSASVPSGASCSVTCEDGYGPNVTTVNCTAGRLQAVSCVGMWGDGGLHTTPSVSGMAWHAIIDGHAH